MITWIAFYAKMAEVGFLRHSIAIS